MNVDSRNERCYIHLEIQKVKKKAARNKITQQTSETKANVLKQSHPPIEQKKKEKHFFLNLMLIIAN